MKIRHVNLEKGLEIASFSFFFSYFKWLSRGVCKSSSERFLYFKYSCTHQVHVPGSCTRFMYVPVSRCLRWSGSASILAGFWLRELWCRQFPAGFGDLGAPAFLPFNSLILFFLTFKGTIAAKAIGDRVH